MKREAGDGPQGGGPMKRTRGGDGSEIRLLIPSKVAGSIIGKGGHNISKLRTELNASVTIPDCPGPERIFAVSADLETMLNVITEILPNLEDFQSNSRNRRHDNSGDGEVDIRMMVHQSQAGCIIGKAGSKIKELRDKTGARIKIYSSCCPQSTDRIVQINGKGKLCIDAIRECVDLLKTSPVKGMSNPYDPHHFDEYYAAEYGGYGGGGGDDRRGGGGGGGGGGGSGRGGPHPRGGGGGGGGGHRNDDDYGGRGGYGDQSRGGGGGGGGGGRSSGGPMGPMGNGMAPSGGGNYGPPSFGGGPNYGPPSMGGSGEKTSTQVTIPKDLAGSIIGRKGARIRKIRMDSGAGITIDEPLPGSNDRIITITGSNNQIQMAQYLLQQSESPLKVNDLFALEIQLTERGWTGDMRIGLTTMNPHEAQMARVALPEFALPDLSSMRPSWIFAISKSCFFHRKRRANSSVDITLNTAAGKVTLSSMLPPVQDAADRLATDVESQIGVVYVPTSNNYAELHFIVNGVDQGAFAEDIPYKEGPFYVVVDVYGCTKQVRILQVKFRVPPLQEMSRTVINQCIKDITKRNVSKLPLPKPLKEYILKSGPSCQSDEA